jgi:hypothetical protein
MQTTKPKDRDDQKPKTHDNKQKHWILLYAVISLVSFLCGVGLLLIMLWKVDSLVALGLTGNIYYIVLLPLGLAAAGFLFGVLNSYAYYSGKHFGGVLKLGGPIIAFALVVIGGFFLVPKPDTFALTVFVHGEGGVHDLALRNSGYVILDLGPDRRREPIGDKGQAYFPSVPPTFRGQEVMVWVDSENYEPVESGKKRKLDSTNLYLPVQKKSGRISGRIQNQDGDPVKGAEIRVVGISVSTDQSGHFEVRIPGKVMGSELDLFAASPGYVAAFYKVVPNSNPLVISLKRLP